MPKRKMSAYRAWLWLAKKWDKPILDEDGDHQYSATVSLDNSNELRLYGICKSITIMLGSGLISDDVYGNMRSAISQTRQAKKDPGCYFYNTNKQGAKWRAKLCRKLAELSKVRAVK